MECFSLDMVRYLAIREAGLEEIYLNEKSKVVSFAPPDDGDELKRINVYYSTGTVGTCVDHPTQGKTHAFLRKVSAGLLRRILLDPRLHAISYQRRVKTEGPLTPPPELDPATYVVPSEEEEVESALVKARGEVQEMEAILEDLRLKRMRVGPSEHQRQCLPGNPRVLVLVPVPVLVPIPVRLEMRREKPEGREVREMKAYMKYVKKFAKIAETDEYKVQMKLREQQTYGTNYDLSLPRNSIWLEHIKDTFDCDVLSVALCTNGIMMLHDTGSSGYDVVSHAGHIPEQLLHTLRGRQKTLPSPIYISMGSSERYFVRFADRSYKWYRVEDSFYEVAKGNTKHEVHGGIASVAFGDDDSWFVVFNDGFWECAGYIPQGLLEIIDNQGGKQADLACVTLGPTGQWYVRTKQDRAWWGGISDGNSNTIHPHKDRITHIVFGDNDNLFLRYE
jgi:hypothetical protein